MKLAIALTAAVFMCAFLHGGEPVKTLHSFTLDDIDGNPVNFEAYKGKTVLIVNVASRCGFTPQYEGLQALYEQYTERGFVVLGLPANNFRNQEPGTNAEIKEFCTVNFGVTFPMFSKISVRGDDIHPLYAWLTDERLHPQTGGPIGWNFTKFLINGEGRVVARFDTRKAPQDKAVAEAIEKALAK